MDSDQRIAELEAEIVRLQARLNITNAAFDTMVSGEKLIRTAAENIFKHHKDSPAVAYAIECEPGDPKLHSLSFHKSKLEGIVTAHGGAVIDLIRRSPPIIESDGSGLPVAEQRS